MRTGIWALVISVMILGSVAGAGCSTAPGAGSRNITTPTPIDVGFSSDRAPAHDTFNFESTLERLSRAGVGVVNSTSGNATQELRILAIQGSGLDERGSAEKWRFIVQEQSGTTLVTYDGKYGETVTRGIGTSRTGAIPMDAILTPGELVAKNTATIFRQQNATDVQLELSSSTYTLTVTDGLGKRTLAFDATTGQEH
ncbi:hypothetical protein [Methanoregula sp.]|uniref:hypothetical protein n=1 Tax=Methanoregula sp. TaxID=2052170 RepID=UPI00236BA694|nr:hypothetical protein [Methanoregula sp.]MDD1686268.1 hypothetical protein [Methanoregula sp.]